MSAAPHDDEKRPSGRGVFIGLGSNLGDRRRHIQSALQELNRRPGVRVLRVSSLLENPALGGPSGQPDYLNAVAELDTTLSPHELLTVLQAIEDAHGRVRDLPDGPRTLDLDLLLYRDVSLCEAGLEVPHPRMRARAFVMGPLAELMEDALEPESAPHSHPETWER